MKIKNLIADLQQRIDFSAQQGDRPDQASWYEQKGLVISRRQAEALVLLLKDAMTVHGTITVNELIKKIKI